MRGTGATVVQRGRVTVGGVGMVRICVAMQPLGHENQRGGGHVQANQPETHQRVLQRALVVEHVANGSSNPAGGKGEDCRCLRERSRHRIRMREHREYTARHAEDAHLTSNMRMTWIVCRLICGVTLRAMCNRTAVRV